MYLATHRTVHVITNVYAIRYMYSQKLSGKNFAAFPFSTKVLLIAKKTSYHPQEVFAEYQSIFMIWNYLVLSIKFLFHNFYPRKCLAV